ncbi:MAG: hypothetical protein GAK31_01114 [Stenotrophomonas maltophilia]|uniref:DoxX family protein n=1 Tax=Stenotrophomonas maltophilia TaxID=40324 RepID=A0A7V8FH41_STEMA|nr:MAG: hypothetical protein GAK31_01114 [Stenotrophomonas maltophilia]
MNLPPSPTAHSPARATHAVIAACTRLEPFLYAVLRIGFGAIILSHGLPKALGTGHGSMADPMASSTALIERALHLPFTHELAVLVMLLETLGGVMLMLGLRVGPVALLLALEMAGIACALGPAWAWIDRGIEYPVLMGLLALYMATRGAGACSVDGRLRARG